MTEKEILASRVCVFAVDPGLSGAVVRVGRGGILASRDFKMREDIARGIQTLAMSYAPGDHVLIEGVRARPGQGVCSMFSFGRASGWADAALYLSFPGVLAVEVFPQTWQNHFRRTRDIPPGTPFDSREIALKLLPSFTCLLKRKKDHNTADAILMAVWKLETSPLVNK